MNHNDRIPVWAKILIALIIVALVMVLYALLLWREEPQTGYLSEPAEAQAQVNLYDGIAFDATLLRLDRRALDEAYHAQLLKLWGVWLADGARHQDNFKNGLANARRAYGLALDAITKREQQLQQRDEAK
jgi:hypothetical protein